MKQKYCSSCGQPIPDGQGSSCSMCYGDPFWGRDGYYLDYMRQQEEAAAYEKQAEEAYEEYLRDQEKLPF